MNRFYVYVLFRPDGTPCYVGKGSGRRARAHNSGNSHNAGVRRLASESGELPMVLIRGRISEAEAFSVEMALIAAVGRRDLGTGPLLNRTAGGDGVSGPRTVEHNEKLRRTRFGRPKTADEIAKISASMKGRTFSLEHREAISRAKKGRPGIAPTLETRKKLSAAHKGFRHSAESKAKIGNAHRGKIISAEARMKMASAKLGKSLSEEHKRKISVGVRSANLSIPV